MSAPRAAILGLGCAAPSVQLSQQQTLAMSLDLSPPSDDQARRQTEAIYCKCGVDARGVASSCNGHDTGEATDPVRFFRRAAEGGVLGPSISDRMNEYARRAAPLAERSARAALMDAGIAAGSITHLVSASCTGFSAPGWDLDLMEHLGLPPSVLRTNVGFMGCHAAINALRVAEAFARCDSGARVLVCCTEICSIHFRYRARPDQVVANALFADGSASAVVGQRESGIAEIGASSSRVLADSSELMAWNIGDHGFEMSLGAGLPATVRAQAGKWIGSWLQGAGLGVADVRSWAVHPGGPKILGAVAEAAGLPGETLRASRAVLAAHGNMSSATVLFILEYMRKAPQGLALPAAVISFGPGIAAEAMLLV